MGNRINTVMQPCFFQLAGVLPAEEAIAPDQGLRREDLRQARRGGRRPQLRGDRRVARAARPRRPRPGLRRGRRRPPVVPADVPRLRQARVTARPDGRRRRPCCRSAPCRSTARSRPARRKYEKRAIAQMIPIWDPSICIDCGKCAMVCPHATIRMKVFPRRPPWPARRRASCTRSSSPATCVDHRLTIQVAPDDCTGCGVCVDVCPAKSKTEVGHKAINMEPVPPHRDVERRRWDYFQTIPPLDRSLIAARHGQGRPGLEPLFEFSRCLRRLRRDALPRSSASSSATG